MTSRKFRFEFKGDFISGRFVKATDVTGEWQDRSPADLSDEIARIQYSFKSIDAAIDGATAAFKKWKLTSVQERAEFLRKYQAALKKRGDELCEAIAMEVGKPLWEAKTELTAMLNKVDITLADSMKLVSGFEIPNIMANTAGSCKYKPLGVMAVVGPFNFPGHLPNGHIVPALATGNVVIFKPSEKTPIVGQIMAECFNEAGFPPGVFNLVQGEREMGRRLCVHEGIAAVLFTGSYEVGTRIKQDTLQQHWKLLALEMGGKNSAIVWDEKVLESTVHEILLGGFLTTGQRCSATSRVIVRKEILAEFVEKLHVRAKAFKIGYPLDDPFMGALIDQSAMDRYAKFLGIAQREGCEIIMRGKPLELPIRGNYVTPSICLIQNATLDSTRKSVYQQTELFAPNLAVLGVGTIEEAIEQANATQYGLVTSVFSSDRKIYQTCWDNLNMGLINWNKATVGASSKLPFGGLKKSGNHFPTALSATSYCTFPVASLEVSEPRFEATTPGLNWTP